MAALSLRYLLDTNILSEVTRATPDARVLSQLRRHGDRIATSAVSWHELHHGLALMPPSRKQSAIAAYIESLARAELPVLPYAAEAAEWHARERARLAAAGWTAPFVDGQIAAIAQVNGLTLVTRNTADFRHFSGLKLQNWFSEN
ncbi:MAG: type II toxin-antitoxin system VapC family toxin [Rhodocyclaceae bacterium]|jgi:tRNA(fMet)-specific endonuclease VapC|nr:type II toxin-antitoxin system VapC family toxin [Rhodocyclaceae bacterium]